MQLRPIEESDIEVLNKLDLKHLPPGSDVLACAAVDQVAYGFIHNNPEVTLILNKEFPVFIQAKATKCLIDLLKASAAKHGISRVVAFTEDMEFADILSSHFGFKEFEGKALFLELS